ncbi:unnamed protein product [Mytilus edulis]|uniref:Integrase zinc-binding domain-containing protein n=1 Tax=Mytilus edulis TaxID=6550 RepID=A0A8S3SLV3_MYTED|nr:unnamed protein product [Mytilus edulis]
MEIDHTPADDIIIQPKSNLKGLLSPNALIAKNETVKAVFRNDTDTFITLKGGHKFGIGMEIYNVVTDQDDLAEDPEVHSDRVSVNVDNPYSCETSENVSDRFSVSSPFGNFETLEKVHVGDRVSAGPPQGDRFSVSPPQSDRFSVSPPQGDRFSVKPPKDTLNECNSYLPSIPLNKLPCGGCKYCTRARNQWSTFEEEVDFVKPLTVRAVSIKDVTSTKEKMLQPYTETELRDAQKNDIDLSTVIAWLSTDFSPSKQDLQMSSPFVRHLWQTKSQLEFRNGILYYFWDDAVAPRLLFITPRKLRQEMLHLCHDLRSAGHLGQDKTLAKLRHTVYWYGMTMDCKLYVSTCQICNRYKKPLKRAKAELGRYHSGRSFERIHLDILGPLPVTQQNNKYVLVIIDQFTKWLECCPLPNQNAEVVAKL